MAGVYPIKPPDQRYQLVSIERIDDPFATPKRIRKIHIPKGPAANMDRFSVERNDHE